ncbi:MAG TPA: NYN domain-containing protein [Gemmatimonadales bacterium]|nr:NYN domain-containing protein [Gemmatimonadales bacterium]
MIDFDNVTLGIRSDLQNQLRRLLNSEIIKGKVAVQRAYADWRRYPQYIVPLSEASIDLIFAPAFGSNKKNATDIRLAIDALELVFTRPEIGTFILLSGDSDFSSLVLKLKEYGKYVIGVGIRESSSDLLVQNCDEYYGYSEITGLTRQSDVVHSSRDPWQLVVEAITQMRADGDVMRSDRLKQVMQELDPTFNEKDLGFSRFSKFVSEAGQRGLVRITKLENGQFEVDLGPNANVSPAVEAAMQEDGAQAEAAAAEPTAPARPRRDDRRPRRARPSGVTAGGMTLAVAFEALRDVLLELGAVGEEATDADQVRERMMQRAENPGDPIFERNRFQRMLRQAHDAGVIDLVKSGETYMLKVGAQPVAVETAEPETREVPPPSEEEPRQRRGGRRRGERGRRGGRGGRERGDGGEGEGSPTDGVRTGAGRPPEEQRDPGAQAASGAPGSPLERHGSQTARPNPRFRRGSRGGTPAAPPVTTPREPDQPPAIPVVPPAEVAVASGGRSVRHRAGSHGRRASGGSAQGTVAGAENPAATASPPVTPAAPADAHPHVAQAAPTRAAPPPPPESTAEEAASRSGFLKRVSAALQKAVRGPAADPRQDP